MNVGSLTSHVAINNLTPYIMAKHGKSIPSTKAHLLIAQGYSVSPKPMLWIMAKRVSGSIVSLRDGSRQR